MSELSSSSPSTSSPALSSAPGPVSSPEQPALVNSPRDWRVQLGQSPWPVLFALLTFVILRLFSAAPHLDVGGDQCWYLVLGRSFPWHRMDNGYTFLIHPPIWGWCIGVFQLVLPLVAAGLAATIVLSILFFAALVMWGRSTGISAWGLTAGLLFLAVHRSAVAFDTHISRVPVMLLSFTLALWAFDRWLRRRETSLLVPLLCNVLAYLVTDQALLLLPAQGLMFLLASSSARRWREGFIYAGCAGVLALLWPGVRMWMFATHATYPAGIDATIEFTQPIPWKGVLQPNLLNFTDTHVRLYFVRSLANFSVVHFPNRITDLLLLNPWVARGLLLVLVAAAWLVKSRRRAALQWFVLSLLLFGPGWLGMPEWYALPALIPLVMLLSIGAENLFELAARRAWLERSVQIALACVCVCVSVYWVQPRKPEPHLIFRPQPGSHFLFLREPVTRGQGFASVLRELPEGSTLMAPVALASEMSFVSAKPVLGLPFDPALLDRFAREYHVTHIVIYNDIMGRGITPHHDRYTSAESARWVMEHPQQFRRIARYEDRYPAIYKPNVFELYEVLPEEKSP